MTARSHVKKVGVIGIDAGICWIGDPCYILHTDEQPEDIGKNWLDFCDILEKKERESGDGTAQFNYERGHAGLGVVVPTGYGDGVYPVYATFVDGRVISVTINFDEYGDSNEMPDDDFSNEDTED